MRARTYDGAADLMFQMPLVGIRLAVLREFKFHPTRRWRFDVAIPGPKVAVEIDGGVFVGGRHSRGTGIEKDCEKYAHAMMLGWKVLRVTPRQVKSGDAVQWLRSVLGLPDVGVVPFVGRVSGAPEPRG